MTSITLPKLERLIHKVSGNKNVIKQLIVDKKTIDLEVIDTSRSSITIKDEENSIYLTCNKDNVPEEIQYAILTNIKPTEDRIVNNKIILKRWLKNPNYKELSPNEIIESWENNFNFIEENPEKEINGLRLPQIGALHALMGHLKLPLEQAIISLPTGTGKTETMLSALIANQCKKLLVTVPSDSLRTQISDKFLTLGLLRGFKLIKDKVSNPIVGIVYQRFSTIEELRSFFEKCNVIVTTMGILTSCTEKFQNEISTICSHLFVDEAHHIKAKSWNQFAENFNPTKIVQYTATPFRNDGKRISGKIIFNFPLSKAQEQGYFQHIDFLPVREYDPKKADATIAGYTASICASFFGGIAPPISV